MNSKTKTVGGSPTSGLGKDFNQFLQGGLTSGNFGANALSQTQGFGGAINQLLQGKIGDPKTLQGFMQGLQGNGGVPNLTGISGSYNSPQFQGLDFGQLGQINTQIPNLQQGSGQAGLNLGGLSLPGFSGAQLNTGVGGINGLPQIQFNPAQFRNIGLQRSAASQGPLDFSQFLSPQGSSGLDPNGSFSQSLQQIAQQSLDKQVADVRERYTGQQGTPSGFAEAALRAQLTPQLISQLSQANQQERGLNLQQQGLNQQNTSSILGLQNQNLGLNADALNQLNSLRLQQSLAGNQQNVQNAQLGLNAQGINTGNMLQNQQLNNSGLLGLNDQFLNQANQQNQFGLQGAQLGQQQQLGLNSNLLSQLGLGNDALNAFNQANLQGMGLQQAGQGQNANNQLAQMAQMLQQSGLMNQFNQGNAQFGANLSQQAQMQNIQNMLSNQQNMNQFGLGQANVGLQNQQQQLQAILGALGPLFGGLNQATGLATPQAQTVQQPSMFSQITGGLANLGQAAAPFFL